MKYKCLVFDHDDTVVNSTATIHHPCFVQFLKEYRPGRSCTLEQYLLSNFHPGFIEMCREEYALSDDELLVEVNYWKEYVKDRIPSVYPGIRELMLQHKAEGGLICVVSHSFEDNIYRDYAANDLPRPDAVYGWSRPPEERKPNPFPLEDIMRLFSLSSSELLMIDDLKPGYDMARSCGVDFAAVGWSYELDEIEQFMRKNCTEYFKSVEALCSYLFQKI